MSLTFSERAVCLHEHLLVKIDLILNIERILLNHKRGAALGEGPNDGLGGTGRLFVLAKLFEGVGKGKQHLVSLGTLFSVHLFNSRQDILDNPCDVMELRELHHQLLPLELKL